MKYSTSYEWDYEEIDEDEDIVNHNHADKLSDFDVALRMVPSVFRLVLVRDVGNEPQGLVDRSWAYVKDGVLPEYFTESDGARVAKVPQKFHNELKAYYAETIH